MSPFEPINEKYFIWYQTTHRSRRRKLLSLLWKKKWDSWWTSDQKSCSR